MTTTEFLEIMAELARKRRDAYLQFFFVNVVLYLIYLATHSLEITNTTGTYLFLGEMITVLLWIVAIVRAGKTASDIVKSKQKGYQLEKLFYEKKTAQKAMEELDILAPPEEKSLT